MKDVIIIPTYNERENIKNLLGTISSLFPNVHILVVDDNSPDQTANEVKEAQKQIPNLELLLRPKKEGLGRAYISAFQKVLASGQVSSLCTMDADFSHSARYLKNMFSGIREFDVVVGSRYLKEGGVSGYKFFRRMVSLAASLYCRIMFRLPIADYTSGFMCIRAPLLRKIDFRKIDSSGFAFLIELKYLLWERGAKFKEFPIILENRREGKSKIGTPVVLEGILLPWKLIIKSFSRKFKSLSGVIKEALIKRGIFFIIYHGPRVLYRSCIKKSKDFFVFQNKRYQYLYRLYNCTCLNERSVEIPLALKAFEEYKGKRILEVGNVLSHYFPFQHDVIDKYEKFDGVINQDVVDFQPLEKYDLIVSVSTLEHVGFDEEPKDPRKILFALENLKRILARRGKIFITLCLGYNLEMDKLLEKGAIKFSKQYFLKRVSNDNKWKEVSQEEVKGIGYDHAGWTARGLVIGIIEN
ncbi:MAG: glycosyltransferase [Candidatus Nealsonbacteria bacterium]|nr:glycosyltransferase [Candidatus Nealsonbacteria bacterium]